jgi:thioredoxin reductase
VATANNGGISLKAPPSIAHITSLASLHESRARHSTPTRFEQWPVGSAPQHDADWLAGQVAIDDRGFIRTDRDLDPTALGEAWAVLGRDPLPYESSRIGLFAVGDVRSGSLKRVAAAVGEGSAAVRSVHDHLAFNH